MIKKEFEFEQELIKLQKELIKFKNKCEMEVLKYKRETDRIFHEKALERERIKSAEIRKSQMRQQNKEGFKY